MDQEEKYCREVVARQYWGYTPDEELSPFAKQFVDGTADFTKAESEHRLLQGWVKTIKEARADAVALFGRGLPHVEVHRCTCGAGYPQQCKIHNALMPR